MKNKIINIILTISLIMFGFEISVFADNSNKLEITMEYKYSNVTNTVTAIMHANNKLTDTKPTWILSSDKYTYTKTFDTNQRYSTTVQDIYGNNAITEININQILNPEVSFEYVYNLDGTITGKIKSNLQLANTKPTWILSDDKFTYTKTFYNEDNYTTPVQTLSGQTIIVKIEIKKCTLNITTDYQYNKDNTVTVTMTSNQEFANTKPTWTLSSDKKIYTKKFEANQKYTTPFQDIYGNAVNIKIEITKLIPIITVEYEYNSNNSLVTVKMQSNAEIANTKPTWTLSTDKKTYQKTFDTNQIYTTPIQDVFGNTVNVKIEITKLIPKITMEYVHNSNNTVTAIMHSNCQLKDTKPTWTLSSDKLTYTKIFNSDQSYSTPVQDIYGNIGNAKIEFKMKGTINIDTKKYPGYKEAIEKLIAAHPNWNFELLYTGLNFNNAVYGEYSIHNANLVPASSGSEWICSVCGTKTYDTGWYGASDKAIAYYMDPRNFLNDSSVFQFLDANKYEPSSVSLEGIQANVNGTFLQNYASDINTACRNKGVNPYYVISRLIQENGKKGSTTSRGMDGGNGKTYYNPFNIGATGNSTSQVIANALAKAKANGWDTMEKALEGGIVFLKANWLDNYQNTLYQNRFDIDSTNGTSLYSHQYMQNLSAAYSEGNLLRGYYTNAGKINTNLTFIIPVYEGMSTTLSPKPSEGSSSEEYPMNVVVNTSSSTLALRSGANTSSTVIARYAKGTILLSVRRGINSTWQHVVTKDGKVGYMSGEYLKQVSDEKTCNYKAHIKTQSSGGLNVRTGPSTREGFSKVDYLPDYTQVTVIDNSTYKGYEGNDWVQWSRIILTDGRQAFVPSSYVIKN